MIRVLFAAIIIVIATSSCKKHDATPTVPSKFYVKYTINGSTVRYTNNTGATRFYPASFGAYGYEHFGNNANGVSLQFDFLNGPTVIPGVYTDTANKAGGSNNPYNLHINLQRSGTVYSSSKGWNVTSGNPCTATITSINADSITGTFSGRVFWGSAANFLDVSGGKFCSNF